MAHSSVHIGTSGWSYKHWEGPFYPEYLKNQGHLKYFSEHFPTVEINSTFYHVPKEETVKNWYKQVSDPFVFSVKASGYITHRKRLNDCRESVQFFLKRISLLKGKLGPILFQLPPSFAFNKERLEEFISYLNKKFIYTFEFRHSSWFNDEIYTLLNKKGIALCITDLGGNLSPLEITAKFTYIRLHGPRQSYTGSYGTRLLKPWQKRIEKWCDQNIEVYCYFDNDDKGYALKDAATLTRLLNK